MQLQEMKSHDDGTTTGTSNPAIISMPINQSTIKFPARLAALSCCGRRQQQAHIGYRTSGSPALGVGSDRTPCYANTDVPQIRMIELIKKINKWVLMLVCLDLVWIISVLNKLFL
jgi:hypothetical protein